ncbi:arsenate reductase ArsC [Thermomicrobiaceae bacterium CFH 74404]|uniref:Arsenate reductase ArsC n=1 Tax=Thermalbibacter longus TaxID=2951981 RepID=A0AA41WHN3_9BACT|nr:arsenate reductase ArsC [Thermalbibacter longus]MCM8749571.1 arsenate reductase ArsC [Thermalbibacter longus]
MEASGHTESAPVRVLFLCTHNAARSQMAEALLRWLAGGRVEAYSAGTEPSRVHPLAVQAMAELGVDISGAESKPVHRFLGQRFDWVITVCDQAAEACPVFPGAARRLHWSLPDPSAASGSEEERLHQFRAFRDRLLDHLQRWMSAELSRG